MDLSSPRLKWSGSRGNRSPANSCRHRSESSRRRRRSETGDHLRYSVLKRRRCAGKTAAVRPPPARRYRREGMHRRGHCPVTRLTTAATKGAVDSDERRRREENRICEYSANADLYKVIITDRDLQFQTSYVFSKILADANSYGRANDFPRAADHFTAAGQIHRGLRCDSQLQVGLVYELRLAKAKDAHSRLGRWWPANWRLSSLTTTRAASPLL